MISVVCLYNDRDILEKWLLAGLSLQDTHYEAILVDNTDNRFSCAAEGLNYGGCAAKGEYIMFVHQDVRLLEPDCLSVAEQFLEVLPNVGVCGVAGISPVIRSNKDNQRNILTHGEPPKTWGNKINMPELVQTLDELLFFVPRKVFSCYQFDPHTCNHWHLYCVDYCLTVQGKGFNNYVLPLPVWHRSKGGGPETPLDILLNYGTMPKDYYKALQPVAKKHRRHYRKIYTTCGIWETRLPISLQRGRKIWGQSMRFLGRRLHIIG